MTWKPDQDDDHAIVRYEGRANDPNRPAEKSRMRRFLELLHLVSRKTSDVAEAYADAEVTKKENEAVKIAAQAAEIATRADLNRTEELKIVNDEIRRIFSDEELPEDAVKMQLGVLAQRHPEILAQSKRIDEIIEKLRLTRGAQVQLLEDEPAQSGGRAGSSGGE